MLMYSANAYENMAGGKNFVSSCFFRIVDHVHSSCSLENYYQHPDVHFGNIINSFSVPDSCGPAIGAACVALYEREAQVW